MEKVGVKCGERHKRYETHKDRELCGSNEGEVSDTQTIGKRNPETY